MSHPKANLLAVAVAACMSQAAFADDGALRLIPAGEFRAKDGRPVGLKAWVMNEVTAKHVIAAARARTDDIVIDYDHQTLHTEKNGNKAPAGGWINPATLEWRVDGLYTTDPRFTVAAKGHIQAEEYRYLSPVFSYNKRTGEVQDLLMVALTNYAAIDGLDDLNKLTALAAAKYHFSNEQEESVLNEETLALLGLKSGASEEDISKAVAALKAKADQADSAQAEVVALKGQLDQAGKPDPAKYVPIGIMKDLQTQVADLTAKVNGKERDDLVDVALSEGKLLPSQEDWARSLDVAALSAYLESAPQIGALGGTQTSGKQPNEDGDADLSDSDLAVCRQMDIDPAEYKKTLASESEEENV